MANRGKGYGPPLDNISEAVGNTPLVKISERICPAGRTIYGKCEYFNPLSSVKDRLALSIIETAEKDGSLKPGQTVVEATSGNTGIGRSINSLDYGSYALFGVSSANYFLFVLITAYVFGFSLHSRCHDMCSTWLPLCDHHGRAIFGRTA